MTGGDLLQRLALWSRRHYGVVFAVSALVAAVALGLTFRLRFDTDVLNLLPRNDPAVRTYVETMQEFGSADYLLVPIRIPAAAVLDPYEALADRLAARLKELPEIEHVDYRVGEIEELLRTFFPKSMLFLDAPGRAELEARLSEDGIRRRAAELRRLIASPQAPALKSLLKLDPLGVAEIFLDRVGATRGGLAVDWSRGYYMSRDHRLLLLLAKPRRPAQDIDFTRRLVGAAEAAVAASLAEWPEVAGPGGPPPPEVDLGGGYLIALSDASLIQRDLVLNVFSSFAGVLLLFFFAFRRPGALLYVFVPLVFGIGVTFGLAGATIGVLSHATSGVAALLLGLGIDFVIVCYGRYAEERRAGATSADAVARMARWTAPGVAVGAVTTTATFYAFVVTDFSGLRQMGLLVGTGILFCFAAVVVLLPAMLGWSEAHHRRRATEPVIRVSGFGVERLMHLCQTRPRPVLIAGVVVTLLAGAFCTRLRFDESIQAMRPGRNRGIIVQDEVSRHFGAGFESMMIVATGRSADEVVARADRAAAGAEELVANGVLNGWDAVTRLVPPPERQREALTWLAAGRSGPLDPARVRSTFAAAAAAEGLRVEPFLPGLDLLEQALALSTPIGLADLAASADGRRLLERYVRETPSGWKSVVYLYPPPRLWKRRPPPDVVRLVEELGPGYALTGVNVVSSRLRGEVKSDAAVAAALGFVLVWFLLWLDFRRLRPSLLSLLPLGLGLVWMLGTMGALDLPMNFMNIFVATMIIGIGTDYGIHVVHRYRETREEEPAAAERALAETGKAVLLSALTTVVGFGSLSLSHYPGLRSMGYVAALGTIASCVAALTVLPAAFSVRRRARWRARAASGALERPADHGVSS